MSSLRAMKVGIAIAAHCLLAACTTPGHTAQHATQPAGQLDNSTLHWERLFTADGPVAAGWSARDWRDHDKPPKAPVTWNVVDGVLFGTGRYTWCDTDKQPCWIGTSLLSDREYGDFVLELEFKYWLGGKKTANGGVFFRDEFELQITDTEFQRKYSPQARPAEFTGAIYSVSAPTRDAYIPGQWNHYRLEVRGPYIKVWLNGVQVQNLDLDKLTEPAIEYNETTNVFEPTELIPAKAKRRGHIGLQDLSEFGDAMLFRNVRIAELS